MHKTHKWKLRGFFWLFNLILQLDNFIKSHLTFSFCGTTFIIVKCFKLNGACLGMGFSVLDVNILTLHQI